MLPFYPKLAAREDAPGYASVSQRDEKCEGCRFFRALTNGGGHCEQFSFHASPEGVCDDFSRVDRGHLKSGSVPIPDEVERRKKLAEMAARDLTRGRISKDTVLSAARAAETARTAKLISLVEEVDQGLSRNS